jgi:hypothetical protein
MVTPVVTALSDSGPGRAEDGRRRDPGAVLVHPRDQLHVGVLCERHGRVPPPLADHLDGHPGTQRGRGVAVPDVVQPDRWEPGRGTAVPLDDYDFGRDYR